MGSPNPANNYCGPYDVGVIPTGAISYDTCMISCQSGILCGGSTVERPCKLGPGSCYWVPWLTYCDFAVGVWWCWCKYRLSHWTCTDPFYPADNTIDAGKMIQHDLLTITDESVLIDIYSMPGIRDRVLSLRSRPRNIKLTVRFDPKNFEF